MYRERRLKRNPRQIKRQPQEICPIVVADFVFPEDIMLCILARLPVISIIRFKSACKRWLELFSTPEFVKMHQSQISSDPTKQSFISHRIGIPGDSIVFWNPAMKLSKTVSFPSQEKDYHVSLGFGYDAENDDYKVVRMVLNVNGIDLYSANSDSWTTIKPNFQFRDGHKKLSNVIVNGNPNWTADVDDIKSVAEGDSSKILVGFDVKKLVFRTVPILSHPHGEEIFVDWNGSIGALLFTLENECFEYIDAWVFDDGEQIWIKKHTFGCIENIYSLLGCTMNGTITVNLADGKSYLFPEAARSMFLFDAHLLSKNTFFEIFGYSESLAYIKGMEKCE